MSNHRPKIPADVEAEVLKTSLRRCCLCYGLTGDFGIKKGQIAHLDGKNTNNKPDNLAFLCLDHHDSYDSTTSQSKNYTIREAKHYREKLSQKIALGIDFPQTTGKLEIVDVDFLESRNERMPPEGYAHWTNMLKGNPEVVAGIKESAIDPITAKIASEAP
jgi:hypothetical protein